MERYFIDYHLPRSGRILYTSWGRKCWLEIPNKRSRDNSEALTNGCFQAEDDDDEAHVPILLWVQLQAMIKLDF